VFLVNRSTTFITCTFSFAQYFLLYLKYKEKVAFIVSQVVSTACLPFFVSMFNAMGVDLCENLVVS